MQKAKELKIKTAKGQTTKKRFPKILLKVTKYENSIEFVRQVRFKANRGLLQREGKIKYDLEYQNTKVSLNVYRAILRPGLYLSETAPCAKVHSSNCFWPSKIY